MTTAVRTVPTCVKSLQAAIAEWIGAQALDWDKMLGLYSNRTTVPELESFLVSKGLIFRGDSVTIQSRNQEAALGQTALHLVQIIITDPLGNEWFLWNEGYTQRGHGKHHYPYRNGYYDNGFTGEYYYLN